MAGPPPFARAVPGARMPLKWVSTAVITLECTQCKDRGPPTLSRGQKGLLGNRRIWGSCPLTGATLQALR